ncbi:hypothetical protein QBC37DRAFT_160480 [Rhypophila decipiens]|uniref:Uncharacterized protein n=1 Tax=Rhypophila decipiens TaxID=261697 RepID=A0AAN6YCH6_9PEZI|nr:hypothetical protein QBC37DRAFT_160480 [Rhypophila decipiens]
MDKFTITVFRYQYRNPRGKVPCAYLESTQNMTETGRTPPRIVAREVGGSNDNHVQWVSVDKIIPIADDDDDDNGKRGALSFRGTSLVHGVIRHASWQHDVGDKIWLRSDMPLFKGRKAVPIVNLTQGRSAEAYIRDIDWIPQKRQKTGGGSLLLTIAGPKFPYYSPSLGPHRMAIVVDGVKQVHSPLPIYTPRPSPVTTTAQGLSSQPTAAAAAAAAQNEDLETETETELERIDRERARLDNSEDHYAFKIITVEELERDFETIAGIVEVVSVPAFVTAASTKTKKARRRRIHVVELRDDGHGDNYEEEEEVRERIVEGLVDVFSKIGE